MTLPKGIGTVKHLNKQNISIEHSLMSAPTDHFVQEDEIDVSELFYGIWAQKMLIAVVFSAFVIASAFYAMRVTPEYKSSAVFEISNIQSRSSISSQARGLASLVGFDFGSGRDDGGLFDRIRGRDFVLQVAKELSLDRDPDFSPQATEMKSPSTVGRMKSLVKSLLAPSGYEEFVADEKRLAEDTIVAKFNSVLTAGRTQYNSIAIEVTDVDPVRAAALANTTMNRLLTTLEAERKGAQQKQLAYLSEQLADALTAMNVAQEKVQDFALQNSLSSTSAFATRSESMSRLRDELKRSQEMSAATAELLTLAESGLNLTEQDYAEVRGKVPIVDDVDFRRLLGIPEVLDQWIWPSRTRLLEFQDIISDRAARARRELAQLQVQAEKYAKASDELSFLQRDASIAEATYQLLLEQTKSQAFTTGFNDDVAKIYQVAVPAAFPSSPNKSQIVALGGAFGLFLGVGLSILRSLQRGRLYSANAIREAAQAKLSLRAPLRFLRSRKAKVLIDRAGKLRPKGLAALAIDLNVQSPKGILCVSAGSQTAAVGLAMWVAAHFANDNTRIALVDLSGQLAPDKGTSSDGDRHLWQITPLSEKIDLLTQAEPLKPDDILLKASFGEDVKDLMERYDRVVFSAEPAHAEMAHRALHLFSIYSVALCGSGLARKSILAELCDIAPIDACLSEA